MRRLLLCVAFVLLPHTAFAKSHLWKFTEVFSNADGSVQFIEMFVFNPAGTGEWFFQGMLLESDANTYVFPNNLPMDKSTFQTWVLIATPAFAALPGAPTPDYIIPPQFFDPAGDELRYRTDRDILTLPAGAVPVNGVLAYLRGGTTAVNTPTNFAGATGTIDAGLCRDGVDNDGDGYTDHPDDPACADPSWTQEAAQCQDGVDNDGQPGTDFDGGESIFGVGNGDPAGPDLQCTQAWLNLEGSACGLGSELVFVLGALSLLRRGRRRGGARAPETATIG